jgi:hypothetical protein
MTAIDVALPADRVETQGAALVCLCSVSTQPAPFLVTTARPLAVVACEALPAADRLLASSGALVAVLPLAK